MCFVSNISCERLRLKGGAAIIKTGKRDQTRPIGITERISVIDGRRQMPDEMTTRFDSELANRFDRWVNFTSPNEEQLWSITPTHVNNM